MAWKKMNSSCKNIDESASDLRKKGYSVSKIAHALNVSSERVLRALKTSGLDEEIYAEQDAMEEKTLQALAK